MTREQAIEAMAQIACDEAFAWGDRLHDWADSGADVRDSFRVTAAKMLDVLIEAGWTSPDQWEQVGIMDPVSTGFTTRRDEILVRQGWVPVFREVKP